MSFSLSGRKIFDNLSFDWKAKRIAVLGRNGSGKSTLARLVAGLVKPESGILLVNDMDLFSDRDTALKTIGIVFQNPDHQIIFPTVIEELKFGFSQQGITSADAEAIAMRILQKHNRENWKDRSVITLSQGQRHFLALISILEMQPEILILDEPFTGLDIPSVARLQKQIANFAGMVLHITHEPALIADFEQVIWIEEGKIIREGEAAPVIAEYIATMQNWGESDARTGF